MHIPEPAHDYGTGAQQKRQEASKKAALSFRLLLQH